MIFRCLDFCRKCRVQEKQGRDKEGELMCAGYPHMPYVILALFMLSRVTPSTKLSVRCCPLYFTEKETDIQRFNNFPRAHSS